MSEQESLLNEIDDPRTRHQRRCEIGARLSKIGDPRPGVDVGKGGVPDIVWLPVAPGGDITLQNETFAVPPFYIAKYQITQPQYQAFLRLKMAIPTPNGGRVSQQNTNHNGWISSLPKPGTTPAIVFRGIRV